jgi:hypothetical protein
MRRDGVRPKTKAARHEIAARHRLGGATRNLVAGAFESEVVKGRFRSGCMIASQAAACASICFRARRTRRGQERANKRHSRDGDTSLKS